MNNKKHIRLPYWEPDVLFVVSKFPVQARRRIKYAVFCEEVHDFSIQIPTCFFSRKRYTRMGK